MSLGRSLNRPSQRPRSTEDIPSILVSDLFVGAVPRSDFPPVIRRWASGGIAAEVELGVVDERVECVYRNSLGGRERRYALEVSWTPLNFGGERPWLHCANVGCQRRCRRLFLDDPYFVCRQCANVRYPSQLGENARRAQRLERAKRLRVSIGGEPVLGAPFPPRPKGMHRTTFLRIFGEILQIERAESARVEKVARDAEHGLGRLRDRWLDREPG